VGNLAHPSLLVDIHKHTCIMALMTKERIHVRVDNQQYKQLSGIKEAHGIPIAEQVRRAIGFYLYEKWMVTESDTPEIVTKVVENVED